MRWVRAGVNPTHRFMLLVQTSKAKRQSHTKSAFATVKVADRCCSQTWTWQTAQCSEHLSSGKDVPSYGFVCNRLRNMLHARRPTKGWCSRQWGCVGDVKSTQDSGISSLGKGQQCSTGGTSKVWVGHLVCRTCPERDNRCKHKQLFTSVCVRGNIQPKWELSCSPKKPIGLSALRRWMKSIVSNQPPVTFQADREHDNSHFGWILPRMCVCVCVCVCGVCPCVSCERHSFEMNTNSVTGRCNLYQGPPDWGFHLTLCAALLAANRALLLPPDAFSFRNSCCLRISSAFRSTSWNGNVSSVWMFLTGKSRSRRSLDGPYTRTSHTFPICFGKIFAVVYQ